MADSQEQDQDPLWGNLRTEAEGIGDEFYRGAKSVVPQTPEQAGEMALYASPAGTALSARDTYNALTPDEQGKRDWLGAGLGAIGMIPVVGSIERTAAKAATRAEARAAEEGIRGYHGSPHDFDKFDLSKIGTGEGNQTYGRGLYIAEAEPVAKQYRDTLAAHTIEGKPFDDTNPAHYAAAFSASEGGKQGAIDALNEELVRAHRAHDGKHYTTLLRARGMLERGEPLPKADVGHMYEVNIAADPESFLDWDKPLETQVPAVKGALQQAFPDDFKHGVYGATPHVYDSLYEKYGPTEISKRLSEAGIPGTKYLDQGSRAAGEGSRNYAVFDDKLISIVRKYGIPGAISMGLITAEQGRQMQEQGLASGGRVHREEGGATLTQEDPLWGNLQETAASQPEEWRNTADHYLPKAQPSPFQRAGRGEISQDDAIRQYAQQTTSPQAVHQAWEAGANALPGSGNLASAEDAVKSYGEGDWLGSALGAIGAVPVLGNIFLPAKEAQVAKALLMEKQGHNIDNILRETGAFRDVDNRWKREISDQNARVTPEVQKELADQTGLFGYGGQYGPAEKIFEHPELYEAEPGLKDYEMQVQLQPGQDTSTGRHYRQEKLIETEGANPEQLREAMLHELQHAADHVNKIPGGANPKVYEQWLRSRSPEEIRRVAEISHEGGSKLAPPLSSFDKSPDAFIDRLAYDMYWRDVGEVRARNVEKRRNLNEEGRKLFNPLKTMSVPADHQIGVKRADGGETVAFKTDPGIPNVADIFSDPTPSQPSLMDSVRSILGTKPTGWSGMRQSTNIEDRRDEPPPYGNETRPFKTTVAPSRKHGGTLSDGTRVMLAKLKAYAT